MATAKKDPAPETPAAPDAKDPAPETPAAPDTPVTMADVAAIQGIAVAPDASTVVEVAAKDVFISEGMRNDLDIHGWAIDPNSGRKVVRES